MNTALFIATLRDKHIDPFIGHLCLLDLTAIRLDQWQTECLAAGSPYMTQRASQLLAQMLDSAVRKGYLAGGKPCSLT